MENFYVQIYGNFDFCALLGHHIFDKFGEQIICFNLMNGMCTFEHGRSCTRGTFYCGCIMPLKCSRRESIIRSVNVV